MFLRALHTLPSLVTHTFFSRLGTTPGGCSLVTPVVFCIIDHLELDFKSFSFFQVTVSVNKNGKFLAGSPCLFSFINSL